MSDELSQPPSLRGEEDAVPNGHRSVVAPPPRPLPGEPRADAPVTPDVPVHTVSVVVPVYQGELTLQALVAEIEPLVTTRTSAKGRLYRVVELIFVHDGAVDGSHRVMQMLAGRHPFIRLIWLSRNFGQHPATLAGMASSTGEWVVTLDEDGQQNPCDIGGLLDAALDERAPLVYAQPMNPPPHGRLRNLLSTQAKWLFRWVLGNHLMGRFNSFRLIDGEIARSLAAYCGSEVYLDVALAWVVRASASCPVTLRNERGRPSGYNYKRLLAHLWRMFLTSGTRPLRLISIIGCLAIVAGIVISAYVTWYRLTARIPVQGWTSLIIVVCLFFGVTLFSLGIIAEYLGITLSMAMGKPLYLIVSQPAHKDRSGA
jgi:undecaprenyl-phosphate 4-deoxy-4-formamido-L-arabinose transferase